MIIEILAVVAIAAVAGSIIAIKKHGSLAAAVASAKREALNIEALSGKIEVEAKAEFAAIAARLRSL